LARHNPPIYDLFTAAPVGVPGDFNNDGQVDAADYITWRENAVANAALPNDNGLATQAARFSLFRSSFGNPGAGSGLGNGNVPEPSSLMLLLAGLLFAGPRRMRSAN